MLVLHKPVTVCVLCLPMGVWSMLAGLGFLQPEQGLATNFNGWKWAVTCEE